MSSTTASMSTKQGIVIGLDGSPGSRHALDWLISQKSFGLSPVVPVMAYELPATADGLTPLGMVGDDRAYVDKAESLLMAEVNNSRLVDAESEHVQAILSEGRPGSVLVEQGAKHQMLVVGCRGRSAITEIVLGSVGSHCVMYSDVPVAIIPADADAQKPVQRVIVGVDGSANSQAALQWTLDHADPTWVIDAIAVYSLAPLAAMGITASATELADQSQKLVDAAIAGLDRSDPTPQINGVVLEGDPRNSLRSEADKADLIVLGARGHQGVAHLLLGSVATSLTHHPTAATVVVPAQS